MIDIISTAAVVNCCGIVKSAGMLRPAQIRAARALLGWRQEDLARVGKVGIATVRRIEGLREPAGNIATLTRIQQALEKAGVLFLDANRDGGIGVRLKT